MVAVQTAANEPFYASWWDPACYGAVTLTGSQTKRQHFHVADLHCWDSRRKMGMCRQQGPPRLPFSQCQTRQNALQHCGFCACSSTAPLPCRTMPSKSGAHHSSLGATSLQIQMPPCVVYGTRWSCCHPCIGCMGMSWSLFSFVMRMGRHMLSWTAATTVRDWHAVFGQEVPESSQVRHLGIGQDWQVHSVHGHSNWVPRN